MEMKKRNDKVHLVDIISETETRNIIESDAQKLLVIQREGHFTFRCVDFLYDPKLLLQALILPCVVHGRNAEELGMGSFVQHSLLCLLSPLWIGSVLSVGKSKSVYRTKNSIPGLNGDDWCVGCVCPWCLIVQLRNELDEQKIEEKKISELKQQVIEKGMTIERN